MRRFSGFGLWKFIGRGATLRWSIRMVDGLYFHITKRSTDTLCEVRGVTPILTRTVFLSRSGEREPNNRVESNRCPASRLRSWQVFRSRFCVCDGALSAAVAHLSRSAAPEK